jgi:hypothetical protein
MISKERNFERLSVHSVSLSLRIFRNQNPSLYAQDTHDFVQMSDEEIARRTLKNEIFSKCTPCLLSLLLSSPYLSIVPSSTLVFIFHTSHFSLFHSLLSFPYLAISTFTFIFPFSFNFLFLFHFHYFIFHFIFIFPFHHMSSIFHVIPLYTSPTITMFFHMSSSPQVYYIPPQHNTYHVFSHVFKSEGPLYTFPTQHLPCFFICLRVCMSIIYSYLNKPYIQFFNIISYPKFLPPFS